MESQLWSATRLALSADSNFYARQKLKLTNLVASIKLLLIPPTLDIKARLCREDVIMPIARIPNHILIDWIV